MGSMPHLGYQWDLQLDIHILAYEPILLLSSSLQLKHGEILEEIG
jgi:hypothetical protein